ncbi:ABC transporter substrate-binding protein [Hymenobacter psychrophilus]|uniref:Thiamine pyrimidine synthase n=1 Tax=Hymenobacter psychrophilus TaxID=651662 RepID=A0A1H3BIP6_9BACT|nr:ABC transporter substrate-binding protein [Hymenobacter psychrophilus]SDX41850.1 ABC-type nitrate/sulfonate/bicarbonate transport system, substrate-binding protein [Hymenobacter psychrophilus]
MDKLTIALDWTVNPNHSGFIVAQEQGLYEAAGLAVTIGTPDTDNYALTPAKKVELGQADFALCPLESIISYRTKAKPFDALAVAALLTEDLSSIVTLRRDDIRSPRDLAGRTYASYHARYEDQIAQQMVRNDGGQGELVITYPEKLSIWNTLLTGQADATWIFDNWEGVEAALSGVALSSFRLADYGIPYGYSPVIMVSEKRLRERTEAYRKFLEATKQGFLYAQANPAETAALLEKWVPPANRQPELLLQSQRYTSPYYGAAATWGRMAPAKVQTYLNWLYEQQLETQQVSLAEIISNELL